jgi:hypothetical protein
MKVISKCFQSKENISIRGKLKTHGNISEQIFYMTKGNKTIFEIMSETL